jgi:hypothetical protein
MIREGIIHINPLIYLGSSFLKTFSWPLKSKKRHRSGSGGSKEFETRKKSINALQQRKLSGTKPRHVAGCPAHFVGNTDESRRSSLEILAPSSSVIQFKYSWPLERFVKQVPRVGILEVISYFDCT